VALALVMLAGAGLLARTLERLETLELGYNAGHLSILEISAHHAETYDKFLTFSDQILARVRALPGVTSATPLNLVPFLGTRVWLWPFEAEHSTAARPDTAFRIPVEFGGSQYFETLGIPLLRGRGFADGDRPGAPLVVVVSESVARRFWPGDDAIGKRIRLPHFDNYVRGDSSWRTVVGIVGDTHFRDMRDSAPMVYFPAQQSVWQGTLAMRTSVPISSLLPAIRRALPDVDSDLWLWRARTMDDFLAAPLAKPRLSALLLSAFGLVALALAAVGLYGVMAFVVRTQTHEIGIRMALGATPDVVRDHVLGQALRILVPGALIGLACAFALSRAMQSMLFQVSPSDPLTLFASCAVLLLAGLAAAYLPARYATRVDPARTLKGG
jgi:predicted permease